MEIINYIMSNLTMFMITFVIISFIIFFLLSYMVNKNKIEDNKIKLLGMFMGLSDKDIFSLSLLTLRYVFIIYLLISVNIDKIHLIFMLTISVLYCFINKRFIYFIVDSMNSLLYYYGIVVFSLLVSYLNDIVFVWYVFIIVIVLFLFIFLYSSYFFVLNASSIFEKVDIKSNIIKKKRKKKKNEKDKEV